MSNRRSHYEIAFESYLARRGIPCVPVEDIHHQAKRGAGAKLFDYVVYPPGPIACLVDVKGRKSAMQAAGRDCRQKTWVTRADLDGLAIWQEVFGARFKAFFAFAYWLAGRQRPEAAEESTFRLAGRHYSFWLVPLDRYLQHQKPLSARWKTVAVPADAFRRISRPLASAWPAAPC